MAGAIVFLVLFYHVLSIRSRRICWLTSAMVQCSKPSHWFCGARVTTWIIENKISLWNTSAFQPETLSTKLCVCVPVLRVKVCTMDWCNRTVCCGSSRKKEFYATSWLRACFNSNEMISNIARTRWETWKQQEMRKHRSRIECLQRDPEKTQQTARKK